MLDEEKLQRFRSHPHGPWLAEARRRFGALEQFVYLCRACGMVFIDPVLSDEDTMAVIHTALGIPLDFKEGWEPVTFDDRPSVWSTAVRAPSLSRFLRPHLHGPVRLLDAGASGGEVSLALDLPAGSQIDLLQTSKLCGKGKARPGVLQWSGLVKHLASTGYQADVMLVLHVLEHVDALHPFLSDCASLLNPDGLLVIEVPHDLREGLSAATGEVFELPHHSFFGPWSLRRLLQRLPFVVESLEVLDHFHSGVDDVAYPVLRALCRRVAEPVRDWRAESQQGFIESVNRLCGNLAGSLAFDSSSVYRVFYYSAAYEGIARVLTEGAGFRGFVTSNREVAHANVFQTDFSDCEFILTVNQADREALKQNLRLPEGCRVH